MDILNETQEQEITFNDDNNFNPNKVNLSSKYFPFTICWSTIPLLSWFIPFVGHVAIGDSNGWLYDFQGPYSIGRHRQTTCFGGIKKYVELDIKVSNEEYMNAIEEINEKYSKLTHNLITQNCHHHVGDILNKIAYNNKTNWGTLSIIWLFITQSKFVDSKAFIMTYFPFFIILLFIITFIIFTISILA